MVLELALTSPCWNAAFIIKQTVCLTLPIPEPFIQHLNKYEPTQRCPKSARSLKWFRWELVTGDCHFRKKICYRNLMVFNSVKSNFFPQPPPKSEYNLHFCRSEYREMRGWGWGAGCWAQLGRWWSAGKSPPFKIVTVQNNHALTYYIFMSIFTCEPLWCTYTCVREGNVTLFKSTGVLLLVLTRTWFLSNSISWQ